MYNPKERTGGIDMELRVLKYFLTVTRKQSISGAASFLHVTQPTLSRQMMDLEKELGKKLFIRGNRKITLTEEGMFLRKRAEEIVSLVEKTEMELQADDEIINGDIYIGGGETDAMRIIAKAAKDIHKDYPGIRYHLYSGNADDVTERLDKGLLDFGVLIEPADLKKYNYLRLPATDTWGVLMRKDSELASLAEIKPKDLCNVPLICSRQTLVDREISQWFKTDYEKLNIICNYNLVYNASLMVDEGMGYALCLDKLVNTSLESNLCFRPLSPRLEAKLDIVWKKYQVFSKAADLFIKKIQETISY